MNDILERNVHPLYAVMAFISAVIVILVLISGLRNRAGIKKNHKLILAWVIFFCIQDGVWGLFASHVFHNDAALFGTSNIFHLSAAFSAFAWTLYFLSRVKDKVHGARVYIVISGLITAVQFAMIIANISGKFMFYVDDYGWYQTTDYRSILFYMQFATYIVIGIVSLLGTARESHLTRKSRLVSIFLVNMAPLLFGVFQLIYPDAPADSVGFSIGCIIIELFLSKEFEVQVYSLEQMQEKLNAALDKAEEANRAKTSFLFSMSHDIRTPMNAILGFTGIAKKHIDNKERVKDSLNKIELSGSQLLNIINEVLEMSRIESGKVEILEEPGNIVETLDEINPMLQTAAIKKSIEYTVEYVNVSDKHVWIDAVHMNRVLVNIISNAIKYTPEGGKVNVAVEQLKPSAEGTAEYSFSVKDSGIGMSKDFLEHLFEEFSREQTSTVSKQEGTGLGLSIAKKIAELMGGRIEVESEVGKGSTFTFIIPLRKMTEEEIGEQCAKSELNSEEKTQAFNGLKVLLVEDNELNREIAVEILEDMGIEVTEAEDGSFAVDIVKKIYESGSREKYFDVIIMDVQMPVMNGYEATKAIRALKDPLNVQIPIVAMTANAFAEDKQKAFEAGMNAHLAKPINMDKLIETLSEMVH